MCHVFPHVLGALTTNPGKESLTIATFFFSGQEMAKVALARTRVHREDFNGPTSN